MSMKKIVTTGFMAGAVALAMANATPANAAKDEKEKCYGVVKAGHNHCGNAAGTHSCAGQSTVDGDGGEWVYVPAGLCEKLVGGSLEPYEAAMEKDHDEKHDG